MWVCVVALLFLPLAMATPGGQRLHVTAMRLGLSSAQSAGDEQEVTTHPRP